jgi:3-keto-disaccharide hydrolase
MKRRFFLPALASPAVLRGAGGGWRPLLNGKNLDGWEVRGDGVWVVLSDGTLVGQRLPRKTLPNEWPMPKRTWDGWLYSQAWLYTRNEFEEFDLQLEYWLRSEGNSGISIRDTSRAQYAITVPPDGSRTPARLAYEIQLNNGYPDKHPSGSIYTFADARPGAQTDNHWNRLDVESRTNLIRVKINGQTVAEHPGDPRRAKSGPIGLQLHDQFSVAQFRNIRIRELRGSR